MTEGGGYWPGQDVASSAKGNIGLIKKLYGMLRSERNNGQRRAKEKRPEVVDGMSFVVQSRRR